MFVVSKMRRSVYLALSTVWFMALFYIGLGAILWVGVFIQPIVSAGRGSPQGIAEFAATVWPLRTYFLVLFSLGPYWFVSVRLLRNYDARKAVLDEMNKIISKMPLLAAEGDSLRYTFPDSFGPSTTEVINLGEGRFKVKSTSVNLFDATRSSDWTFEVSKIHFRSRSGAFLTMMQLASSYLQNAKKFGAPRPKRMPAGKRTPHFNPGKSFPVGKPRF